VPYRFVVDRSQRLIYKEVWGEYDDGQSRSAMAEFDAIDGRRELDELHDLRRVTHYDLSTEWMKDVAWTNVARRSIESLPTKRVAYVVNADVGFGMGRLYQAITDSSSETFRVMRSIADAEAWLGVHVPEG